MKTLGEVVSFGIWVGILNTLKGKYFQSGNKYFYFPETNITNPLEVEFENNFHIYSWGKFGDIKLRVTQYIKKIHNPTKVSTLIALEELYVDYEEISKETFDKVAKEIEEEINKYI